MKIPDNSLQSIWEYFKKELTQIQPISEIRVLYLMAIEAVTGLTKNNIYTNPHYRLTESQLLQVNQMLKRLRNAEPIQYILGKAHFFDFMLHVNPHVLIPRPETEELVDFIVKDYYSANQQKKSDHSSSVLDIGTGSGCIAIALKRKIPASEITGIDISTEAINTAKQNASLNHASVELLVEDIFQLKPIENHWQLIVSNPPYITQSEMSEMQSTVKDFEPATALYVPDTDSLKYYKTIAQYALNSLKPEGKLYFEINQTKGQEIVHLLEQMGFKKVILKKDINAKDRFIKAEK